MPVIGSPLFLVSGPELVIAQCKAGIIGSFPALNARPQHVLGEWITRIKTELAEYQEQNDYLNALPYEPDGYRLASTPLNDCIMAAYKLVPAFVKRYSIDKMNTIFLTDGCSDGNNGKIVDMDTGHQHSQIIQNKFRRGHMMSYDKNNML